MKIYVNEKLKMFWSELNAFYRERASQDRPAILERPFHLQLKDNYNISASVACELNNRIQVYSMLPQEGKAETAAQLQLEGIDANQLSYLDKKVLGANEVNRIFGTPLDAVFALFNSVQGIQHLTQYREQAELAKLNQEALDNSGAQKAEACVLQLFDYVRTQHLYPLGYPNIDALLKDEDVVERIEQLTGYPAKELERLSATRHPIYQSLRIQTAGKLLLGIADLKEILKEHAGDKENGISALMVQVWANDETVRIEIASHQQSFGLEHIDDAVLLEHMEQALGEVLDPRILKLNDDYQNFAVWRRLKLTSATIGENML
ncbi:MAG: hypothetical protein HY519_03885 [Candidatus Aenigmarchaeota archaeon]|nr:hypothetical protein [Candidatus Aenigmarchaeota archaeon]